MTIAPYLSFNGQCREAFEFYEKALGGKITSIMTGGESPMADKIPPEQHARIMHISLNVDGFIIAGADAPPEYFSQPQGFCVTLNTTDAAQAEQVFNALSPGGKVQMPLSKTFWAEKFGMLIDRYGTPWMVNCGQAG